MTDIVQLPEHLHILNTSYLFIAEDNSASQRFKIQIGTIVEMTDIVQLLDHLHIEDILFVDRTYGQSRMIRVIVTSIVKVVFTRIIFGSERLTLKGAVKLCHCGCACSISKVYSRVHFSYTSRVNTLFKCTLYSPLSHGSKPHSR